MGRGIKGEVRFSIPKLAASCLMNENKSFFGQARFQIELKPHAAAEAVATLQEGKEVGRIGYYTPEVMIRKNLIVSIDGPGFLYSKGK